MFFKARFLSSDRPAADNNHPPAGQLSRNIGMNGFFRRSRSQNIIGQIGASVVTFALCWQYTDPVRLIAWMIAHQCSIVIMAFCFTSKWTTSRLDEQGIPKFATAAMFLTMTICGSVLLTDVKAAGNIAFPLAALIVIYAVAAGAMITLGPIEKMARLSLFGLLVPGTIVTLVSGHYVIGTGTLFFLGVVALVGVSEMSQAYQELVVLRTNSARAAAESRHLACHDSLTGLFNRIGIAEEFVSTDHNFRSAMFIDLDRFKQVNDLAGHQTGDQILKHVAERLTKSIPAGAAAGRLGGDEFLVLLATSETGYLREFASRIITLMESPFVLPDGNYSISASIGISIIEEDATLESLFYESDNAMYQAKRDGRGNAVFFTDELRQQIRFRTVLENELRAIINRDEFPVHGQPVFDLVTGRMRSVELLARPKLKDGTVASPSVFIPFLEELGLIHKATRILLKQAVELKASWQTNAALRDVAIAINISPRSLACDWLITDVCEQMTLNGLHAGDLIFEITEHALISDEHQSEVTLRALCELGVVFALDDFGTGYSSLNRLLRMPISYVKIDKSIVQKSGCERNERLMCAIVEVARSLGQDVIAEGIETELELAAARLAGVSCGQGYHLARPMPLDDLVCLAQTGFLNVDRVHSVGNHAEAVR